MGKISQKSNAEILHTPVVNPWPKGKRCACIFTFDLDAEAPWKFSGINEPIVHSMGRFGPQVGVPMLLNLLDQYDIKSTFFVPGWTAEKYTATVEAILRHGHDIGCHGYLHEPPGSFRSAEEEEEALLRGAETLTKLTGMRPRGYRAPLWEYSQNTISLLHKHGFEYSGDMMDTLLPDYLKIEGRQTNVINLPGHWTLDDGSYFSYHINRPKTPFSCRQALENYQEEFYGIYAYGGLFTMTMHPYIIGRPSRVLMLQKLIEYIRSYENVWIARPVELVEYWRGTHPATKPLR